MTDRQRKPFPVCSRSWILRPVSFNCISQRAIDPFISRGQSGVFASQQGFAPLPTCFAVGLLSPVASFQVPAPKTTFTETPLFEDCSCMVGPRFFDHHQHFSRGSKAPSPRPLTLEYRMHCHCHPETMELLAHTSSDDMSLLVSGSLCVIFASCVPTFHKSFGNGLSSAIMSLMMISSFSMTSSDVLGPVRNSRLMSCGIISLTKNVFCASSITLNWCSYSATNDHAVSLSFSSFVTLQLLGVSQVWAAALQLGCSTTWARYQQPALAVPRNRGLVPLERPSGLWTCTFRHSGQCHRQLTSSTCLSSSA